MGNKVKRVNVGVTEEDRKRLEEISIKIFGRVNISATIAYLLRKYINDNESKG